MSKTSLTHLDPVRLERQLRSRDAWVANYFHGVLEATTGFGKTAVAMLCIEYLKQNVPSLYLEGVMVVVPTVNLKHQWEKRLKERGLIAFVETIQTVSREGGDGYRCGLLILDEVHLCSAPVFRRVFEAVGYSSLLGLTATLPEEDERREVITDRAPIVDSISLLECLKNDWVSPFQVYNLPVVMTQEEDAAYEALNKNYHKDFAVFNHDFDLAMECVTNQRRRQEIALRYGWDVRRVDAAAFRWIRNTQQRKELLYNLRSKHEAALEIIRRFPERLTVTFSQSIESAELMKELAGASALAYHSNVKGGKYNGERLSAPNMRRKVLERFASTHHRSTIRVLCTAKAFDVGADIPHIDMGIVLSGTSKTLQAIQRYGRTLRKVDGKRTIIVELYAVRPGGGATQDMKWLRSRQQTIRSQVAWITDADQIV